jgi:hypothetical protein
MNNSRLTLIMVAMFFLIVPNLTAQTSPVTEKKNKQEKTSASVIKDLNANGVDDAKEVQQTGKTSTSRMRDQFVDANGDGICDNREQGLGFRRGKMESGKQTGRRQQGKQK